MFFSLLNDMNKFLNFQKIKLHITNGYKIKNYFKINVKN